MAERLEIQGRSVKDMEVDALEGSHDHEKQESLTTKEWIEWTQAAEHEEEIGYMGKGKGKGKNSKHGKGNGTAWTTPPSDKGGKGGKNGKSSGKGKETRVCHWCQNIGHLIAECRARAAGKPKTKPGIHSLH